MHCNPASAFYVDLVAAMSAVSVQAISWKSFADVGSFYSCKSEGVVDILKSQLRAFHWTIRMGFVRPTRQLPQHAEPGSEGFAKGRLQHHVRRIVAIRVPRTAVQKPFHLDFLAEEKVHKPIHFQLFLLRLRVLQAKRCYHQLSSRVQNIHCQMYLHIFLIRPLAWE